MRENVFLHSEDLNLSFVYINLLWNSICPFILWNGSITSQDLIVKRWNYWNSLQSSGFDSTLPVYELRCHGFCKLRSAALHSTPPRGKKKKR